VQILVVVASIQMTSLKTEVEKGSVTTVIDHGLAVPKRLGNSNTSTAFFAVIARKGNRLIFLCRVLRVAATLLNPAKATWRPGRVLFSP